MANRHVGGHVVIRFADKPVPIVDSFIVLGSELCINEDELPAFSDRASKCSRSFYKWQSVFLCQETSINMRIAF